jgi:general secretion pathway protein A
MYHKYFGLDEAPFSIAVNPRYLFMSERHREALAHLIYGVGVGGGFILLSGEVGTGKTTITRCLLEQLPPQTDIALILNPAMNAVQLLAAVCDELHIEYASSDETLKGLSDKLHQFLLANHQRGRNTVLLIDEAQHLQFEVLEQIRLLTNLETNTQKLLQIILVGQPELRVMLARPELRQLSQRITARYQLKPFTAEETSAYIRHRLQVAGLHASQELFPQRVVQHIHEVSHGIPRLINVLCDRILLGTYGKNKAKVDMAMARQATIEVQGEDEELAGYKRKWVWPAAGIAGALLATLVGLLWWQWSTAPDDVGNIAAPPPSVGESVAPEKSAARGEEVAAAPVAIPAVATQLTTESQPRFQPEPQPEPQPRVQPEPQPEPQPEIQDIALPPSEGLLAQAAEAAVRNSQPQIAADTLQATQMERRSDSPEFWFAEQATAINLLLMHQGTLEKPLRYPCGKLHRNGWRCDVLTVESWRELLAYNTPVVLEILTKGRLKGWSALVGVRGDEALIATADGEWTTPLAELGELWTGSFVVPWDAPPGYTGPLRYLDESPAVEWLSQQFATLDGQASSLAGNSYNELLQERVRLFQADQSLVVDGVAGMQTLLRINQQLHNSPQLITEPATQTGAQ